MKIIKTAYQGPNSAHETAFVITGLFRKRFYRINDLGVYELPVLKIKDIPDEKTL